MPKYLDPINKKIARLEKRIAELLAENEQLRKSTPPPPSEWVSVKERLPDHEVDVIVANAFGYVGGGFLDADTGKWWAGDSDTVIDEIADVTFWQPFPPLPQPPERKEEGV